MNDDGFAAVQVAERLGHVGQNAVANLWRVRLVFFEVTREGERYVLHDQ